MNRANLINLLNNKPLKISENYLEKEIARMEEQEFHLNNEIKNYLLSNCDKDTLDIKKESDLKWFINYVEYRKKKVEGKLSVKVLEEIFEETGKVVYKNMLEVRKLSDKVKKLKNILISSKESYIKPTFAIKNNEKGSIYTSQPSILISQEQMEQLFNCKSIYKENLEQVLMTVELMQVQNIEIVAVLNTTVFYKGDFNQSKNPYDLGTLEINKETLEVTKNTLTLESLLKELVDEEFLQVTDRQFIGDYRTGQREHFEKIVATALNLDFKAVCSEFLEAVPGFLVGSVLISTYACTEFEKDVYIRFETDKHRNLIVTAMDFDGDDFEEECESIFTFEGTNKETNEKYSVTFCPSELTTPARMSRILENYNQLREYAKTDHWIWQNLEKVRTKIYLNIKDSKERDVIRYYYFSKLENNAYKHLGLTYAEGEEIRKRVLSSLIN